MLKPKHIINRYSIRRNEYWGKQSLLKELSKIPVKERQKVEKLLFEEIENYKSLSQIPNVGKLKGYSNYYKIRFGDYRVGLKFEKNILYFE